MSWKAVELSDVAVIDRNSIKPEDISDNTTYLGLENIDSGGKINGKQIVLKGDIKSSKFLFSENHILYGKLRPYLAKIAMPDFNGICSTDIIPILPKDNADKRFIAYFLKQQKIIDLATERCSGANLPRISPKELSKFKIPLPPLPEQKRIASILDATDALRSKRRQAIAMLDELLQATFLDMFGDPVTNPKGWEAKAISETESHVQIGPFGSLLHKEDYKKNGIPLINPKHIQNKKIFLSEDETISEDKFSELPNYHLKNGDIIIGRRGEMGRCAIVNIQPEEKLLCGTGSLFIRPNISIFTSMFLSWVFSSQSMKSHLEKVAWGVTMANLNKTKIQELRIPLPPLTLQTQFAKIVEKVEAQKAVQQAHLAELDTLFASLQQRAFAGDL